MPNILIPLRLDRARIIELLHGHGGGYSPWLHEVRREFIHKQGCFVVFDKEHDGEGTRKGKLLVRTAEVKKGLIIMAKVCPHQFGKFLSGNDDDISFDAAWQCIIFGKMVYA